MTQLNWTRMTAACACVVALWCVACADESATMHASDGMAASSPTSVVESSAVPGMATAMKPIDAAPVRTNVGAKSSPSSAGASAGIPANASAAGASGAGGVSAVGGSGGAPQPAAGSTAAGAPATSVAGPVDYGARGPYEVQIEKNVGEAFRNTNLTDDAARCAALVGGLGADADGGDWAIYPDDMDRQLYTLYRPKVLEDGVKYPVITWGNGTCSQPLLFEPLLGHLREDV